MLPSIVVATSLVWTARALVPIVPDSMIDPDCEAVNPGYGCWDGTNYPRQCPSGSFESNHRCFFCPPGSFQASRGQSHCDICHTALYSDVLGASSCKPCPVGRAQGQTTSLEVTCGDLCQHASYRGAIVTTNPNGPPQTFDGTDIFGPAAFDGTGGCTTCALGFYADGGTCHPCPAGTDGTIPAQLGSCAPCGAGETSSGTRLRNAIAFLGFEIATCDPCDVNHFVSAPGECSPCPAGQQGDSQGGCETCALGLMSPPGAPCASVCPPGSEASGPTQCTWCPTGYYSTAPVPTCTSCPGNTFTVSTGTASPSECLDIAGPSKFCPNLAYFVNMTAGVRGCQLCPHGTFVGTSPTSSPEICEVACLSTHVWIPILDPSRAGSSPCLGGCWGSGAAMSANQDQCLFCEPSMQGGVGLLEQPDALFGATFGQDPRQPPQQCSGCGHNEFPAGGACFDCPAGRFSAPGAIDCQDCPSGHYRAYGSLICSEAPLNRFQPMPTGDTTYRCPSNMITLTTASTSCVECPGGQGVELTDNQMACVPCPAGTYKPAPLAGISKANPCLAVTGSSEYTPGPGYLAPLVCAVGYLADPTHTGCIPAVVVNRTCYSGSAYNSLSDSCVPCPQGTAQPLVTQNEQSCPACEMNETAQLLGLQACPAPALTPVASCGLTGIPVGPLAPPGGLLYDAGGGLTCAACYRSRVNLNGPTDSVGRPLECEFCPAGSQQKTNRMDPVTGLPSSGCRPCRINYYNPFPAESSRTSCVACPGGTQSQPVVPTLPVGLVWLPAESVIVVNATGERLRSWSTDTFQDRLFWEGGPPDGELIQGAASCEPCPPDTVRSLTDDRCRPVPAGWVIPITADYTEYACREGDRAQAGVGVEGNNVTYCYPCPNNTISLPSDPTQCSGTCPSGQFRNPVQHVCFPFCYSGSGLEDGHCVVCPAGKFAEFSTSPTPCQDCPAGEVQPHAGESGCIPCASAGDAALHGPTEPCSSCRDVTGLMQTGCQNCSAGSGSTRLIIDTHLAPRALPVDWSQVDDRVALLGSDERTSYLGTIQVQDTFGAAECQPCPAGTYRPETRAAPNRLPTCLNCPQHTWSASNATACVPCPVGQVALADGTGCAACPAGQYGFGNGRGEGCDNCPVNTFNPHTGSVDSSACLVCPPNCVSNPGATNCTAGTCPPGNQPNPQAPPACLLCTAGRSSDDGIACNNCTAGSSTNGQQGATTCSACSPGFFAQTDESSSCDGCAPGRFAPAPSAVTCHDCAANSISAGSSANCTACLGYTFANAGRTVCETCPAGQGYDPNSPTAPAVPCSECGLGFHSAPGGPPCVECSALKTTLGTNSSSPADCVFCSVGAQPDPVSHLCVPCGNTSVGGGNISCFQCGYGTRPGGVAPNDYCERCPEGWTGSSAQVPGQGVCLQCTGNTVSTGGTNPCYACGPGLVPNPEHSACVSASSPSASVSPSLSVSSSVSPTISVSNSASSSPGSSDSASPTPSPESSAGPPVCPPGHFKDAITGACELCPPYTHQPEPSSLSTCPPCFANDDPGYTGTQCTPGLSSDVARVAPRSHGWLVSVFFGLMVVAAETMF